MKSLKQTSRSRESNQSWSCPAPLQLCAFALNSAVKFCAIVFLLLALTVTGCTTKSAARQRERAAFYEGQTRAFQEQLAAPRPVTAAPSNVVTILGPVKCPAMIWSPDMTLIKTIVAAEYIPAGDPSQIIVTRAGQQIPVSPAALLNGEDLPLLPGDVVELRP